MKTLIRKESKMAKFYVESGECQQIVQSEEPRAAALWAVHVIMENLLPIDELDWIECDGLGIVKYENGFLPLGKTLKVSERGFGRDEAGEFETLDVLTEWNQLLVALARLDQMMIEEDE